MKKLTLTFSLLITVVAILQFSCTKSEDIQISFEDKMLKAMTDINYPFDMYLTIAKDTKNATEYIIKSESLTGWGFSEEDKKFVNDENQKDALGCDCAGTGLKFVNCVKALVDQGKTVAVTKLKDNTYCGRVID
jgi:hypothetical protein